MTKFIDIVPEACHRVPEAGLKMFNAILPMLRVEFGADGQVPHEAVDRNTSIAAMHVRSVVTTSRAMVTVGCCSGHVPGGFRRG